MISSEDSDSMNSIPIALGNPPYTRELTKRNQNQLGELAEGSVHFEPPDSGIAEYGMTSFWYKRDEERYETGCLIVVFYEWNKTEPNCFENKLLRRRKPINIKMFHDKIFNRIKNFNETTIAVSIWTVKGSLEVHELPRSEDLDSVSYPPLTDALSTVPRVAISSLEICPVGTSFDHIDIVTKIDDLGPCRQWYAFKRYAFPLEDEKRPLETLLTEAELLCRMDSPYIMKPSFIVTDNSDGFFIGYLMPFMPAGTLTCTFGGLKIAALECQPMFLHPRHLAFCGRDIDDSEGQKILELTETIVGKKSADPKLPWSIKHTWAGEATSALVTLHSNAIFSGDVKLDNILLDRDGHLKFIDVAPQSAYTPYCVAPEIDLSCEDDDYDLPLTEARDIFAFGLVLWQIAEEAPAVVARKDLSLPPRLTWKPYKVPGATPRWYRDLVGRCIDVSPEKRPSAKDILDVLESKR